VFPPVVIAIEPFILLFPHPSFRSELKFLTIVGRAASPVLSISLPSSLEKENRTKSSFAGVVLQATSLSPQETQRRVAFSTQPQVTRPSHLWVLWSFPPQAHASTKPASLLFTQSKDLACLFWTLVSRLLKVTRRRVPLKKSRGRYIFLDLQHSFSP